MKILRGRNAVLFSATSAAAIGLLIVSSGGKQDKAINSCVNPAGQHVCIMKTIFGLDTSVDNNVASLFKTPEAVDASVKKGLDWMAKAQGNDGGWGAGFHSSQGVMDPHAVPSDPATTALVAMSLLRTENTLDNGELSSNLKKATEFLLQAVENCPKDQTYLTTLTGTQPQIKLGRNIDVILTSQFLTNLLRYDLHNAELKKRVERSLDICISRIQKAQDADGSWKDGGWAPVLQSALANNALETAMDIGRKVDTVVLANGYRYQKGNYNAATQEVVTGKAAGVVLYGLSSTTRSSAKDARKARDIVARAKREGKIKDDKVTEENLRSAGVETTDAKQLVTAYSINTAANTQASSEQVMKGYGNNGGEEFMSFLMTGESMIMQGGDEWKKWYDMMSGKLVSIQNSDGSWNGHHCITSPVFCTATCLLILSIHKDMQFTIKKN